MKTLLALLLLSVLSNDALADTEFYELKNARESIRVTLPIGEGEVYGSKV